MRLFNFIKRLNLFNRVNLIQRFNLFNLLLQIQRFNLFNLLLRIQRFNLFNLLLRIQRFNLFDFFQIDLLHPPVHSFISGFLFLIKLLVSLVACFFTLVFEPGSLLI